MSKSVSTRKNRFGTADKNAVRQQQAWKEFFVWLKTSGYKFASAVPKKLTDRALFKCTTCGTEKESQVWNMWAYKGKPKKCKVCEWNEKHKEFISSIPKEYKFVNFVSNNRIELKHKCGLIKEYGIRSFKTGNSYCDCLHRKTYHNTESYKEEVAKLKPEFECVDNYVDNRTPIWHKHTQGCGKRFKQAPFSFMNKHRKCPKCHVQKNVLTTAKCQEFLDKQYGKGIYQILGERKKSEKTKLRHKPCGKTFQCSILSITRNSYSGNPCPNCYVQRGTKRIKIKGKFFRVRGTEDRTLKWILNFYKDITVHDIKHGKNLPTFNYVFEGKTHKYVPDFWIPKLNLIIESKDTRSFGIAGKFFYDETLYERNQSKAKAVISSGYRFKMSVYSADKRIVLPKGWYNLPKKKLISELSL